MQKKRILILSLLIALFAVACGGAQEVVDTVEEVAETAAETAEEAVDTAAEAVEEVVDTAEEAVEEVMSDDPLKFGLILVGPQNDRGWSQAHYEGGQYIVDNLEGSEMILFDLLNPADKPEATLEGVVDDMVEQGAKLVITTSDEFEEDTAAVAEKYPDVTFINSSGDDVRAGTAPANLGNIMGQMVHMKAIKGCAAAMESETGKIGYLGPLINFETRREAAAAYLGAKHCWEGDTPLEFTVTWIGFWFNIPGVTLDPTEVVNGFVDSGMDVILSGIDTSEAIDVSKQRVERGDSVLAGAYGNIAGCDNAPDICLGSAFFNWGPSYLQTAQEVANGTWTQDWEWNAPNWDDLTDTTKTSVGWTTGNAVADSAALDAFAADLASGAIDLWAGPLNLQDGSSYVADGATATDDEIWYLPALFEGMEGPSE